MDGSLEIHALWLTSFRGTKFLQSRRRKSSISSNTEMKCLKAYDKKINKKGSHIRQPSVTWHINPKKKNGCKTQKKSGKRQTKINQNLKRQENSMYGPFRQLFLQFQLLRNDSGSNFKMIENITI